MPEVISLEPQEFGHGRVFLSGSKTSPGTVYTTVASDDGKFNCTCPGWTYRYKCRHVDFVRDLMDIDGDDDDIQVSLG